MNDLVIHTSNDVFNKPKDAALAYYLSGYSESSADKSLTEAYILGNAEGTKFCFSVSKQGTQRVSSATYKQVGIINPYRNEWINMLVDGIQYIYEIAADGKLVEITLKKLTDVADKIKKEIIDPIFDYLAGEVEYAKSYINNPYKIDSLILGFLAGVGRNLLESAIDISEIISLTMDYLLYSYQDKNEIHAFFTEGKKTLAEKIDLLEFAIFHDAYYLGKTLGDIVTVFSAAFGAAAGAGKVFAGASSTIGSIIGAPSSGGTSLIALAPGISVAFVGVADIAVAGKVLANAAYSVRSDFDGFGENRPPADTVSADELVELAEKSGKNDGYQGGEVSMDTILEAAKKFAGTDKGLMKNGQMVFEKGLRRVRIATKKKYDYYQANFEILDKAGDKALTDYHVNILR